ncbi:DUF58 domain-containing protein [Francisellaceae bacterium]|nr:DUF58 domain-containing protein [Francisellaceae bacterium]
MSMHKITKYGLVPDFKKLLSLRYQSGLLELKSKKKVAYLRAGDHLSHFKGRGIDFDEVRLYDSNDDIRHIDWRVTARTGIPHTKLYKEERERPILLLVDMSTSMQFGTKKTFKSVIAAEVASIIAWSALGKKDRVGGFVFSEALHKELRPTSGRKGILNFISTLGNEDFVKHKTKNPANMLLVYLKRLRRVLKPGTLIYIISDFAHLSINSEELIREYVQICQHNEVLNIHVYDPLEKSLPLGNFPFSDGVKRLNVSINSDKDKQDYQSLFESKIELLDKLFRSYRAGYVNIATNDDVVKNIKLALQMVQK